MSERSLIRRTRRILSFEDESLQAIDLGVARVIDD